MGRTDRRRKAMTIPSTLQGYLRKAGVKPQTVAHPKTLSASRTAQVCHVSGDCVAKGVLVKDAEGYLLAVIPASHHIEMDRLSRPEGRRVGKECGSTGRLRGGP